MGSHDLCIEQSNRRGSLEVLDNVAFAASVKLGGYTVTQLSSRTAAFGWPPFLQSGVKHRHTAYSCSTLFVCRSTIYSDLLLLRHTTIPHLVSGDERTKKQIVVNMNWC